MKKINALLLLLSFNSYGVNLSKNPIYAQIIKNKPSIDKTYAMEVSNIIYKMHKKYHIPTRIFTAILSQESQYQLKAKGCHVGIREVDNCKPNGVLQSKEMCSKSYEKVKVCSDFGIAQINWRTAERYNFNLNKLTQDLKYSIEAGAIVLKGFMERYENKENNWWSRYNSSSNTKRQIYEALVKRFL